MSTVRIALPPLTSLMPDTEFEFACLDRHGYISQTGVSSLVLLAQANPSQAVECFLHPADSVLTRLTLPPLSAVKIKAAVACAAHALMLGRSEQMHVAHSLRDASGQVFLSWLPTLALERFGQLMREHRLTLRGLYPASYALPVPPAGHVSACMLEGHLLLRLSAEQGLVEPLIEESLEALIARGSPLHWIGEGAPAGVLELPAQQRWSGLAPGWGLHGGVGKAAGHASGWGRALACCALAVGVWVFGLNLYAAREASVGQQLKTQMTQRVKQAFPELPVVLNPLQQARQQLTARQENAAADNTQGFASLVLHAASAMPFMAGSVQSLVFENAELQVSLPADARRNTADKTWQAALTQSGITAHVTSTGWALRPVARSSREENSDVVVDDE